jgi:lipopolysaccharide/colanic/teichoic acid biosynthesis glycosyltransferase
VKIDGTSHPDGTMADPQTRQAMPGVYFRFKVVLGRSLALLLLIPGLPLILASVLLVRLTSRGPGLIHQTRVGKNGRLFVMHKIRTMIHDAEKYTGPTWTQTNDPRITPVGRLLRKIHVDELPQLFNVLKGEMVLIGPRPERPEIVDVLSEHIRHYRHRLAVPPGITGLAQINLPPDTDLESVRRKLALDLDYVNTANAGLDLRILLCTCLRMIGIPGELAMRALRLRRNPGGSSPSGREAVARSALPCGIRKFTATISEPVEPATAPLSSGDAESGGFVDPGPDGAQD